MKSIIFDAGPIISLATNNLLFILPPLKKIFNGKFYITLSVKKELIDRPFEIKKFKFEAIQIEKLIEDGILEIIDNDFIRNESPKLLEMANTTFRAFNNYMQLVHFAEMSTLAAAINVNSDSVAIDEKTTRLIMENPKLLLEILKKTLHTSISVNELNLREFRSRTKNMRAIRSIELVAVAYEHGILDGYITKMPDAKRNLLESVLWGVKIGGCAVSRDEIAQILRMEIK
ncbi:MAG TPA: hypothetical protein VJJ52_07685 [Candidatus Nanoarchaeia archaeon]|nr:hypothetical protein [Candidatus Nanoarchaeia archaeon]